MDLIFGRSKWDMPDLPLEEFLRTIKTQGFSASEIFAPSLSEEPEEIARLHHKHGLGFIAMIASDGATLSEHLSSLEQRFLRTSKARPILINCHTGRDIFPFEDNLRIFELGISLSREYGIPLVHETHRGRATYSTFQTKALISALPQIRLNADFSHWCCVHESLLDDQQDIVDLAINHADYIHARVGYIEGPQITDPRGPEWEPEVEKHISWWSAILHLHRKKGTTFFPITPEFGPPPYLARLPFTRQPVTDVSEINVYMMQLLKKRFL
jgi:sugar phosphate isomerase/epimerase